MLEKLNHTQLPTPLKIDNFTKDSFVHKNIHQKHSKSWDMRYHWLHERHIKQQFNIFWDKGSNNHADYFTKYHPAKHYLHVHDTLKYVRDRPRSTGKSLYDVRLTTLCHSTRKSLYNIRPTTLHQSDH